MVMVLGWCWRWRWCFASINVYASPAATADGPPFAPEDAFLQEKMDASTKLWPQSIHVVSLHSAFILLTRPLLTHNRLVNRSKKRVKQMTFKINIWLHTTTRSVAQGGCLSGGEGDLSLSMFFLKVDHKITNPLELNLGFPTFLRSLSYPNIAYVFNLPPLSLRI